MTDVDTLVKIFIKMRDKKAEHEAAIRKINEEQELIEIELLRIAAETGSSGFKTAHGTTYISQETRYTVSEGNAFFNFVKETGNVDLLERRASASNIRQYMEDHDGEIPPGLSWFKQDRMKIRRSTSSK